MNGDKLKQIFSNYIEKFELINSPKHGENYKWRVAYKFHDLMDPNHPEFPSRIHDAVKLSANLIDSNNRYCFSSLVKCSEEDPEAVRELFKALFADDGGDLAIRQHKITQFIKDANALIQRLVAKNAMYMNDQRSAMGYLFLYDPDHHYLYKASEATNFASCIEFYDDWGPGTAFKLDVYYRMCDMIVDEIRNSPELLKTNASRFVGKDGIPIKGLHPDTNYHILVFDIIYGAPEFRYNFYNGIPFSPINAKARKLHQERVNKAHQRYEVLIEAQEKAKRLAEAKAYFEANIIPDLHVDHKAYGSGVIVEVNGQNVTVNFPDRGETKKFEFMKAFSEGFLRADIPDLAEKSSLYRDVIIKERMIEDDLKTAQKKFEEYIEYFE